MCATSADARCFAPALSPDHPEDGASPATHHRAKHQAHKRASTPRRARVRRGTHLSAHLRLKRMALNVCLQLAARLGVRLAEPFHTAQHRLAPRMRGQWGSVAPTSRACPGSAHCNRGRPTARDLHTPGDELNRRASRLRKSAVLGRLSAAVTLPRRQHSAIMGPGGRSAAGAGALQSARLCRTLPLRLVVQRSLPAGR